MKFVSRACCQHEVINNNPIPRSPFPAPHLFVLLVLLITSCTRHETQHDGLLIAVSIPPQAWFVSQVAGDNATAMILVPPGQNPHSYEPTPRQIQSLASAGAWILSGAEFEITLRPKIEALFPNMLVVDGTQGVQFRLMEANACCHSHRSHAHSLDASSLVIDRHTWLGREPSKILASHVKDVLIGLDKENEDYYQERYENLVREIDIVFDELKIVLSPLHGRRVFVYHPSFGYFFDEFGIIQEAVEIGGREPTVRQLNSLMTRINEERPAAIFVQTQFPVNAARTLAATVGAQVIELDHLAIDWMENIRFMGQMLQAVIQ